MQNYAHEAVHFRSDDGLALFGRDYVPSSGAVRRTIICLSGLTRNSRDFDAVAGLLVQEGHRVATLDYRGRGLSDWDPKAENYNILREAQDVLAFMDHLGIESADFIGTSRGGLILHVLAALAGSRIGRLVLNDVGPVIEPEGLMAIRDYLSVQQQPKDLADAARRLKLLHGADFPALSDDDWDRNAWAIYAVRNGVLQPDYDRGVIASLLAMDFNQPLADLWPQYSLLEAKPLLILRGAHSRLLSKATVEEMIKRHKLARALHIPGQGHAPQLEHSDVWPALRTFFDGSGES